MDATTSDAETSLEGPHRHVPELARVRAYPAHGICVPDTTCEHWLLAVGRIRRHPTNTVERLRMRPLHKGHVHSSAKESPERYCLQG